MSREIRIHPDYDFLRGKIAEIPGHGYTPSAVYCHSRNTVERVDVEGVPLVVKRFKRPNVVNRFVYRLWRAPKAVRSYDNALRLTDMGIDTPAPVAVIVDSRGLAVTDSWYVCRHVDALPVGHYVTEEDRPAMGGRFRDDPMLRAFLEFALSLFRRGVYQRDFNRGNFLVSRGAEGEFRFSMVDINRLQFRWVTPAMVAMAFTRFGAERCPGLIERLTVEFGTRLGYGEEECRRAAARCMELSVRMERRRKLKRKLRGWLKGRH